MYSSYCKNLVLLRSRLSLIRRFRGPPGLSSRGRGAFSRTFCGESREGPESRRPEGPLRSNPRLARSERAGVGSVNVVL